MLQFRIHNNQHRQCLEKLIGGTRMSECQNGARRCTCQELARGKLQRTHVCLGYHIMNLQGYCNWRGTFWQQNLFAINHMLRKFTYRCHGMKRSQQVMISFLLTCENWHQTAMLLMIWCAMTPVWRHNPENIHYPWRSVSFSTYR